MAPLTVDPNALSGAGATVATAGDELAPALATLTGSINANTGYDAAGVVFGRHYVSAAGELLKAITSGANACRNIGYGIQTSAVTYSRAEANSDISGRTQSLPSVACPAALSAPGAPSSGGTSVPPPMLWSVVQQFVGSAWPDGNPAELRSAAAAWRAVAGPLNGAGAEVSGVRGTITAQIIGEAPAMAADVDGILKGVSSVANSCEELATSLEEYAGRVEKAQQAIRNLCNRLGSIGGIAGTFFEFLEGHGLDEVQEIADEIKTVIGQFGSEADATLELLESSKQSVTAWIVGLEKSANKHFVEFFGEPVGMVLSSQFNRQADSAEGVFRWGTGIVENVAAMNPTRFASDPEGARRTWDGLVDSARLMVAPLEQVIADPHGSLDSLKGLVHADDWSKDRPMVGATEVALDIASAALPIGKAGAIGKAGVGSRVVEEESAAAKTEGGHVGPGGGAPPPVSEIAKNATAAAEELDGVAEQPIASTPPAGGQPVSLPADAPHGTPPVAKTPSDAQPTSTAPAGESHAGPTTPPEPERVPAAATGDPVAPRTSPEEPERASALTVPGHIIESASNRAGEDSGKQVVAAGQQEMSTAAASETIQRASGAHPGADAVSELLAKPSVPRAAQTSVETPHNSTTPSHEFRDSAAPSDQIYSSARADSSVSFPDKGEALPAADDATVGTRAVDQNRAALEGTGGPDAERHLDSDSHGHSLTSGSETGDINDTYQETNGVPISKDKFDEILAAEKGYRPDPDTYLPPEYIQDHLRSFDSGSSRIILRESYEEYGIGKPDTGRTEFVLTTESASKMIAEAAGDPVRLAERLGIPADQLAGDSLVMVEFHPTGAYKAIMPSGNEWGTNAQWLPGGRLPHGDLEAVVETEDMINGVDYTVIDLFTGEVL